MSSVLKPFAWPNADVLPYDYEEYGKEVAAYLAAAKRRGLTISSVLTRSISMR